MPYSHHTQTPAFQIHHIQLILLNLLIHLHLLLLHLFHQAEEHFWPGGFKNYINTVVNKLPQGEEALTNEKVFWINIILVWLVFSLFGFLSFINIGFGLLIVIFSIMNCVTHIFQGTK